MTPDYLAIGHVAKDVLPDGRGRGIAAGGTVTYSALTAQRLGLQSAVVTSCSPSDERLLDALRDEGVWVHARPSPETTLFRNSYDADSNRAQVIGAQAAPIAYGDVPEAWRAAPIVHLGPIAQELPAGMPSLFPGCLLGVTPQGWMRKWDLEGTVARSAWPIPDALQALPHDAILVLSMEDLGHDAALVENYVGLAPLVVITQGSGDAFVYVHGRQVASVPASPAQNVDPTGAGDVFAAALFVRYRETRDIVEATRFAHAAAAHSIGGEGISAIPRRERIKDTG